MNKPENKLAFSVLATLTTGIALIYTFIMFHRILFAVVGVSILFLITAYILVQNIVAYITMRNKSMNVQIKNYIDDISQQLETMNGAQSKLGKATYLYTRQAAEKVSTLENNYAESQAALYKNLSTITNTQNKATKLMIKYDLNNTTKLISTIKDMRNHLSETMVQGFDQIQPNNDDVVAVLNDIVSYLKSQPQQLNQGLSIQLNNVAHELQNISTSIQQVQIPAGTPQVQTMADPAYADTEQAKDIPTDNMILEDIAEDIPEAAVSEDISTIDTLATAETASTEKPVIESIPEEPVAESIPEETVTNTTESPDNLGIEGKSSNDMLSADEIAALFAAADPAPKKEEPVTEETADAEPFTPTFTVVGKSTEAKEETEELTDNVTPITSTEPADDPNRQLSADEIAALFAASDPAPKKEEPVVDTTPAAPAADDSNRQLSTDEIAALFAASDSLCHYNTSSRGSEYFAGGICSALDFRSANTEGRSDSLLSSRFSAESSIFRAASSSASR